jgi:hypothetical protein
VDAKLIVDVFTEIEPGVTAIVGFGVEVTVEELIVAPIVVAVPDVTPVKVAV